MKDFFQKNGSEIFKTLRVAIVSSEYHGEISSKLAQGAAKVLTAQIKKPMINYFTVPGAYELPQAVQMIATSKKYDAIIPVGCLIRGETAHFDYISQSVALGLDEIGRTSAIPVSFGVLTVNSMEQAKERAGGKYGNKGEEAAFAVLDLVKIRKDLNRGKSKKSA